MSDELRALVGAEHVRTDDDACAQASSSWSPLFFKEKQAAGGSVPDRVSAVVSPADADEVAAVVRWANAAPAVLVPVGGGSNTVGSNDAPRAAAGRARIAVDLTRLRTVRWDEESLRVHAGAGCRLSALEEQLNAHEYTLGHFPRSLEMAAVGGAVATDAVGIFSGRYGRQRDLTVGLEAVLPTGAVVRTSAHGAGPNLHHLLIGSEGAFGIVTEATLRMSPQPEVRAWAAFTFPAFGEATDALRLIYRSDARPAAARLFDADAAAEYLTGRTPAGAVPLLVLGFEGSEVVQTGQYQMAHAVCQKIGGKEQPPEIGDAWFDARYRADWMAANGRPGGLADVFSVWCPWSALKDVHAAMRRAAAPMATGLGAQAAHADPTGAALDLFVTAQAEPNEPEAASALYRRLDDAVVAAALEAGAETVAHHYGVGRTRRAGWKRERGPEHVAALRALKSALDPNGVLPSL